MGWRFRENGERVPEKTARAEARTVCIELVRHQGIEPRTY